MSKDRQLQPLNLSDYIAKREKSRGVVVYQKQQQLWDDHPRVVDAELIEFDRAKDAKRVETSVVNTQNIQTQNIHYHYHDPKGQKPPKTPELQKKPKITEEEALLWVFSLVGSVFLIGLLLSAFLSGA